MMSNDVLLYLHISPLFFYHQSAPYTAADRKRCRNQWPDILQRRERGETEGGEKERKTETEERERETESDKEREPLYTQL